MRFNHKYVWKHILRFLCIIFCFFLFSLCTTGLYAQRTEDTGVSVNKIIHYLERHYKCRFFYEENTLDFHRKLSVDLSRMSLDEVLDRLSKELSITCKKTADNLILLKRTDKFRVTANLKRTLQGRVVERSGGRPLPGVKILANGIESIGVSDKYGNYRVAFPESASSVAFLLSDYRSFYIPIPSSDTLTVFLETYQIDLEEVLVVGYGQQALKNVTGAISVLNQHTINNQQGFSTGELLHGVAGVYVSKPGGQPGVDRVNVNIRGLTSFSNNKPLVLVDGVEYLLGDLNPGDIQSISVLKDAASASIYGVKSANGVVLVKTKTATDEKLLVEYDNHFSLQQVTYLPDAVWDPVLYMNLKNRALENEGKAPDYSQNEINEYKSGMQTDSYIYPATNWFDLIFRSAFEQKHNLRMKVGKDRYAVYASLGYQGQKGVVIGTDAQKYALNLNSNYRLSRRMNVFINLKGLSRTLNEPHMGMANFMSYATRSLPVYTPYLEDGRYGDSWVKTPGHNVFFHPMAHVNEGLNRTIQQRVMMNTGFDFDFPGNIKYSANVSYNKGDEDKKIFHPIIVTYNPKTGEQQESNSERQAYVEALDEKQVSLNHNLNWEGQLSDNHFADVLVGMSYMRNQSSTFWASSEGFLSNKVTNISVGNKNHKNGGSEYEDRLMSFYGRGRYNYQERYLLEVALRVDGSSRFSPSNRWGVFPSVSLGWRIDKESFLKDVKVLSLLKWRFSWGLLGNQDIDDYQYQESLETDKEYNFGQNNEQGVAKTSLFNSGITWEKTSVLNMGIDVYLFSNQLKMTGEIYHKRTYDILQRLMTASQVGNLQGGIRNIGEIINNGYELTLSFQDQIGIVNYSLGGSLCRVTNEVSRMKGNEIINGRFIVKENYPVDSYYLLQTDGIFKNEEEISAHAYQSHNTAPGDLRFRDVDGNQVIDDNDRIVTGKCFPDYVYGFFVNVRLNGLECGMSWEGVSGVSTYPVGNLAMPFYNGAGITKEWINGSWSPEYPDAALPRLMQASSGHDNYAKSSTFWLQNASYLRLKNVFIRYNFPSRWLTFLRLADAGMFVSGQNLLTLSRFDKFDPEKNLKNQSLYEYPSVKKWSIGVSVTFK